MTYWQKRQQQLNNQLEKDEEKLKIKLSKSYDIEQKKLEKEIASYYQTYGENNVIEYRKLMESLSYEDKQLLLQRMDEFAEKYPQYAHLMPVRESIYKLNRLEGIQTSIKLQQLEMNAIDNAELQQHFEQLALRSANSSAEQLGFGKNFYTVNSDLITKTVNKQWADGKNFSERIWNNRSKLADYLNNDFAMAIARGDSYQRCIKALGERFDKVSRNDMYRLIYTEGTFVQNEASITPLEEDFEEYEISIADERACNHCKAMQDKKFSIKDRKAGVNFPPFHSWCRCSFTIAVDDWDKWIDDYVEKHGKEPEKANNTIDFMSNSYRPTFTDSKPISFNKGNKLAYIPVKKVSNSKFNMVTDVDVSRRNKAVRLAEKLLTEIKDELPKEFNIPQIAIINFDKHSFGTNAIGGYDKSTGILYLNSKYDTIEKIQNYVTAQKGQFANTTEYAPLLHELGHKYYYDCIESLAKTHNIEYNKAKKIIDSRIYDYIHERNIDGRFLLDNLSGYANAGYFKNNYTEIIAEAFSSTENNSVAKDLTELMR